MTRLPDFIRQNTELILGEWETFARGLATGTEMDIVALRDHAKAMLATIADDLDRPQSGSEQAEKSKGHSDSPEDDSPTAAQSHGAGRAESGFSIEEMVSEFRALRASVIRSWTYRDGLSRREDFEDLTRFNEAIDQAIAESITTYAREIRQTRDRFLGILGHDLRTPIGAIITSSQFMLDTGDLKQPFLELTTRVTRSARRMNRMVADLLEFTRERFGDAIPINRVAVDLARLLEDAVSELRASHPGTTLSLDLQGDLKGHWDPDRLAQVLSNLLSNAVHHSPAGRPIAVSARAEGEGVAMSVCNEGPVIPVDDHLALFEPMKALHVEGVQDRRHLGLGLYIVDRIVAGHGGRIDVTSTVEGGTTFKVWLPREPQQP
jgi:signal transduction histidine kinase